mmetsp:Transcript_7735/g.7169  ORF Transcript_7735/g.7169 Transcript_7735/m.7169 type:complete len:133 (+) Transcript_7735:1053-1451(+)
MGQQKTDINSKFGKEMEQLREFIETTLDQLKQQRLSLLEKYNKKFTKVKDVCSDYFSKNDLAMTEVQVSMKQLIGKYQDWSKILIEPQSLNDARLYALETRVHEEEEVRIKEYEYVRDLMKKLIYSLEQKNI